MIKSIDKESIHQICSGQVILDLSIAVKELIENSLDAGAKNIEIRLKEYGEEYIEVIDNGSGVEPANFASLTKKHHTSKLEQFSDLLTVTTFGFRGEALSSLCALATVTITTRSASCPTATRIVFDHTGAITSQTQLAREIGTTVHLAGIFKKTPVRYQEFKRNIKKEFTKLQTLLQAYALITTGVKLNCFNQTGKGPRSCVLSTTGNSSTLRDNVISVFGVKINQSLDEFSTSDDLFKVTGLVSKVGSGLGVGSTISGTTSSQSNSNVNNALAMARSCTDRQFLFVNHRPVELSSLTKAINGLYQSFYKKGSYPIIIINIETPTDNYDVNVTPDKRTVFIHKESDLINMVRENLRSQWETAQSIFDTNSIDDLSFSQSQSSTSKNNNNTPQKPAPPSPSLKKSTQQQPQQNSTISSSQQQNLKRGNIQLPNSNNSILSSDDENENPHKRMKTNNIINNNNKANNLDIFNDDDNTGPKDIDLEDFAYQQPVFGNVQQSKISDFIKPTTTNSTSKPTTISISTNNNTSPAKNTKSSNNINHDNNNDDNNDNNNDKDNSNMDLDEYKQPIFGSVSLDDEDRDSHPKQKSINNKTNNSTTTTTTKTVPNNGKSTTSTTTTTTTTKSNNTTLDFDDDPIDGFQQKNNKTSDICLKTNFDQIIKNYLKRNGMFDESFNQIQPKIILDQGGSRDNTNSVDQHQHRFTSSIGKLNNSDPQQNQEEVESELTKHFKKEYFNNMVVIGQFNLGFIIAKLGNDLFIIDQHAADEKYNYESLQKSVVLNSQQLLKPDPIELTAEDEMIVIDNLELFKKNGFGFAIDLEAPPRSKVKLTSFPYSKGTTFGIKDVYEMIYLIKQNVNVNITTDPNNSWSVMRLPRINSMLASRACKMSIRVGMALKNEEMKQILTNLSTLHNPWCCPHGRPTMRHLIDLNSVYKSIKKRQSSTTTTNKN
eukprot:gene5974-7442_t